MIETTFSDLNSEIKTLATVVEKAGISLKSESGFNSRYEALAFIVRASCDQYGENAKQVVSDLVREIDSISRSAIAAGKRPECEVSYNLYLKVKKFLKLELKSSDPKDSNSKTSQAIWKLYKACICDNSEKYEQGQVVSFTGVPKNLVPSCCRFASYC